MKILVLHLSDIHLVVPPKPNSVLRRIEAIASAAATYAADPEIEGFFIAITGDIAFSGNAKEYEIADEIIAALKSSIEKRVRQQVHFVMVPGNHDCDFSLNTSARDILLRNVDPQDVDSSIAVLCTAVQERFFHLRNKWMTDQTPPDSMRRLLDEATFSVGDKSIRFRMLNTAWTSSMKELPGSLVFPTYLVENTAAADVVLTMFHHPYAWLEPNNAKQLLRAVEATSDIILTGHEHDGDIYTKDHDDGQVNEYLEGGVLQESHTPSVSTFNLLLIDLTLQCQTSYKFAWDEDVKLFQPSDASPPSRPFQRNSKRLRDQFEITNAFDDYLHDPGVKYFHPAKETVLLDDLFVYPDFFELPDAGALPTSKGKPPVRSDIISIILKEKKVLLVGSDQAGKTSVAKHIFSDLRKNGLVPLLLTPKDVSMNSATSERLREHVRKAFSNQYRSASPESFLQLDLPRKALVFDDWHRLPANARGRGRLLRLFLHMFEVVVLVGGDELKIEDLTAPDDEVRTLWELKRYEILPFGHLRRSHLITRWYTLGRRYTEDEEKIHANIIRAENTISTVLGRSFSPYPVYVLIILQNLEAKIHTATSDGSQGYLLDALINTALESSATSRVDVDTGRNYLSDFAYHLYSRREESASTTDLLAWHAEYCRAYRVVFSFDDIKFVLLKAGMWTERQDRISFRYKGIYYFFVAQYLGNHITESTIQDEIRAICRRVYNEDAANIMISLCYIEKNPFVLETMLAASRALLPTYPPCDLASDSKFLNSLLSSVPKMVLEATTPEANRQRMLEERDQREADTQGDDSAVEQALEVRSDDDPAYKANAVFKTIQILGQILRNFPGSLKGDRKLQLALECYALGLRFMSWIFELLQADQVGLVRTLVEIYSENRPGVSTQEISDDVKQFLFFMGEQLGFAVVKHISESVGLEKLAPTFADVLKEAPSVSNQIIDVSIKMDHFGSFPDADVVRLFRQEKNNYYTSTLVRRLAWQHFYLYKRKPELRQSVCSQLGIEARFLPDVRLTRNKS